MGKILIIFIVLVLLGVAIFIWEMTRPVVPTEVPNEYKVAPSIDEIIAPNSNFENKLDAKM